MAARANTRYLQRKVFAKERELYRRSPLLPADVYRPNLCLALSGGGMRSAAFSIGVMKGLHHKGLLDKVEIISGVSGGAYALSWYMSQRANGYYMSNAALFDHELARNSSSYDGQHTANKKNHLGQWVSEDEGRLLTFDSVLPVIGAATITIPFNVVFNGIFNTYAYDGPVTKFYESRLHDIFQAEHRSVSTDDMNYNPKVKPEVKTMGDLRDIIKNSGRDLPYPIFNTTASNRFFDPLTPVTLLHKKHLHEVFEITPSHIGSDINGYHYTGETSNGTDHSGEFHIDAATEISGAALDTSGIFGSAILARFISFFNMDLGRHIKNYNWPTDPDDFRTRQAVENDQYVPVINYLSMLSNYNNRAAITDIHLADGGQSENLGAFALVRRMCRNIIIVDAEHDRGMEFGAYHNLKDRLWQDMHVDMCVMGIDSGSDSDCLKGIEFVDKCREHDNCKHPITKGKIRGLPLRVNGTLEDGDIDITYIKLSIDKDKDKDKDHFYGVAVHKRLNRPLWQLPFSCIGGCFPQQWTVDQNFSGSQFNGYRDLGCRIVEAHLQDLDPDANNIALKTRPSDKAPNPSGCYIR